MCAAVATKESEAKSAGPLISRTAEAPLPMRTTRVRGENKADELLAIASWVVLIGNIDETDRVEACMMQVTSTGATEHTDTSDAWERA
jgi:hypothetical protein